MNKPIILLDLNSTLCSLPRPPWRPNFGIIFEKEEYRQWLVELLRDQFVILFTVRHEKYRDKTLENIQKKTNWQPQQAFFRYFDKPSGAEAHRVKNKMLNEKIFPQFPEKKGDNFYALESNNATQRMYDSHGIPWSKVFPDTNWDHLPFEVQQVSIFD